MGNRTWRQTSTYLFQSATESSLRWVSLLSRHGVGKLMLERTMCSHYTLSHDLARIHAMMVGICSEVHVATRGGEL